MGVVSGRIKFGSLEEGSLFMFMFDRVRKGRNEFFSLDLKVKGE